jgi:hypothetical protein
MVVELIDKGKGILDTKLIGFLQNKSEQACEREQGSTYNCIYGGESYLQRLAIVGDFPM